MEFVRSRKYLLTVDRGGYFNCIKTMLIARSVIGVGVPKDLGSFSPELMRGDYSLKRCEGVKANGEAGVRLFRVDFRGSHENGVMPPSKSVLPLRLRLPKPNGMRVSVRMLTTNLGLSNPVVISSAKTTYIISVPIRRVPNGGGVSPNLALYCEPNEAIYCQRRSVDAGNSEIEVPINCPLGLEEVAVKGGNNVVY